MILFIDVDGVLLGQCPKTKQPVLANYAQEFLEFSLLEFDCFWLTTHCKGVASTVTDYLAPYSNSKFLSLAYQIKPTNFKTFKTEALFGDFLWIDDQPTIYEILFLEEQGWLHRWLEVDTRKNINGLVSIIDFLKAY